MGLHTDIQGQCAAHRMDTEPGTEYQCAGTLNGVSVPGTRNFIVGQWAG